MKKQPGYYRAHHIEKNVFAEIRRERLVEVDDDDESADEANRGPKSGYAEQKIIPDRRPPNRVTFCHHLVLLAKVNADMRRKAQ